MSITPVALVTGAGSGIGRAAAVRLAAGGYRVALVGRTRAPLESLAAELGAERSLVLTADVGITADTARIVDQTVASLGRLDVLVNNAGVAPLGPIHDATPELIERVFRVNALGVAETIARAWPVFVAQKRGCIVNISTIGTIDPFPGFFVYAASKASVNLMARSCAKEGAEHNIRAFAIAPGAVETPMLRSLFDEKMIPREACLAPDDVARVIMQCVQGERDGENGSVIPLSAG